jgi:hypothetical protein
MFDFDTNDKNNSAKSVPAPADLTQEELAEIVRISENYSLSRADRTKLLLLLRDRKRRAYAKSSKNE